MVLVEALPSQRRLLMLLFLVSSKNVHHHQLNDNFRSMIDHTLNLKFLFLLPWFDFPYGKYQFISSMSSLLEAYNEELIMIYKRQYQNADNKFILWLLVLTHKMYCVNSIVLQTL